MARTNPPTPKPWRICFFQRHPVDDPGRAVPASEFLDLCPPAVAQEFQAVLAAVAEAPPPSFSGGGKWEAMHDDMAGYYEARVMGPRRELFRLFCRLERPAEDLGGPSIVVIAGMSKRRGTAFTNREYRSVRRLGEEFSRRRTVL